MHQHVRFKACNPLKLSVAQGTARGPLGVHNHVYFQVILNIVACRTLIASVLFHVAMFYYVLAKLLDFIKGGAALGAIESNGGGFSEV